MTDELRPGRDVHLISGYLAGLDRSSRQAHQLGLNRRFAAAMTSFRTYEVEAVFDVLLYGALVAAVARAVGADSFRVEGEGDSMPRAVDFGAVESRLAMLGKADEPPTRITMHAAGNAVVIAESEPYARIGGPAPYHDTYTVAFYCADARIERVADAVRQACIATEAQISSESRGEPDAPRGAWMKLVSRFMRSRNVKTP